MGPYPHDAPPPTISAENPMGTDGFEFVEFCHPGPGRSSIACSGAWASSPSRSIGPNGSRSTARAASTSSSTPSRDRSRRVRREAWPVGAGDGLPGGRRRPRLRARAVARAPSPWRPPPGPTSSRIPAIEGIGGLHIYLVDRYGAKGSIYDVDFEWIGEPGSRACRARALVHRPPHAQRASRPARRVGRASTSASSTSARSATSTSRAG